MAASSTFKPFSLDCMIEPTVVSNLSFALAIFDKPNHSNAFKTNKTIDEAI